jgi:hypothetical protein
VRALLFSDPVMRVPRVRLLVLTWLGRLLNLAGLPGFVQPGRYQSAIGVNVAVRVSPLFTVVSVDGFEIYFYRLSGGIDGVSVTADPDYTAVRTRAPVRDSAGTDRE